MTSLAVISSAVAKIESLKSVPDEAYILLDWLRDIRKTLESSDYDARKTEAAVEGEELEKQVARLSYEIIDAIDDASIILGQRKKSGVTKLREIKERTSEFKAELDRMIHPESCSAGSESTEAGPGSSAASPVASPGRSAASPKAGPGGKLKERSVGTRREKSAIPNFVGEIKGKLSAIPSRLMKKKAVATTEQETQAAASEPKPSHTGSPANELFDKIRNELLVPQTNSSEVFIVGERGMGKTALARKLYIDFTIRECFQILGWVSINHKFQIKSVLRLLLSQLGPGQHPDLGEMNEATMIAQIFHVLKDKQFLLVLDDIGGPEEWESIRLALPLTNSSRVIITTCSNNFSSPVEPAPANLYRISGLTQSEILTLLKVDESGAKIGEAIYDISGGSPLYATILGRSLQLVADEADEKQFVSELLSYEPLKGTSKVLGASYKRLFHGLKPCLLYLGQFPRGYDIQVEKLYLLLVAENLIPQHEYEVSPQSFSDDLYKLDDLKLVQVQEDILSTSRLHKSCKLHDQVREFCISKGSEEEFIEIVDFESPNKEVGPHTRRLAIYMREYRVENSFTFKSQDTVKKITSLLIFDTFESAEEKPGWASEIHDLTEFSYLRVLNFDEVNFKLRKLPKGLDKLILLKFLSFRGCWLEELPSSLSNLTQLETLDLLVHVDCSMIIPGNIFTNMKRMVHLFLPRMCQTNNRTKVKLQVSEKLETLVNFDTEIFEVGDLSHFKKLKILSTISRRHHSEDLHNLIKFLDERAKELQHSSFEHSSVEITGFDCYDKTSVSALNKLLRCQFVQSIQIEGQIDKLPEEDGGKGVVEIVLHGSELEHDPMGYFGKFQKLRSLVLSNDAFMGTHILISAEPLFPNLRSLKLHSLQYLESLIIEEGAMPKLSTLQIHSCGSKLQLSIPKTMYDRLKSEVGGNGYSVIPLPSKFSTTL